MSGMQPYEPPRFGTAEQHSEPGVLIWYKVYCVGMALVYLLLLAVGVAFVVFATSIADREMSAAEARVVGVAFTVISVPLFVFFMAAPFLPRRSFAWIYGIVAIALGMTSACCWPIVIPLLIFWIKPETRNYFQEPSRKEGDRYY